MTPLSVTCWKWTPPVGYRSHFGPETVNTLQAMVARHCRLPHTFTCVTDDAIGLHPSIRVLPLPERFGNIPSPHGGKNPSCYRRLEMFAPDAAEVYGDRIVSLDLDCVIAADVTPLWDRDEDFVIWGDWTNPKTPYNGSMMLLRAGTRSQVYTEFDPLTSPQKSLAAGFFGSDQGWLSYCLGTNEPKWTRADGVYSYRNHLRHSPVLPAGARVIFFHGSFDPWLPGMTTRHPWIAEHYRRGVGIVSTDTHSPYRQEQVTHV